MESYKLRVSIGNNHFEAEGPQDAVTAQFQAWKELIAAHAVTPPPTQSPHSSRIAQLATEVRTKDGHTAPWDIFRVDDKRKLVTLAAHPTTESRDADAVLLVLYGYRKTFEQDEVVVTRIKRSLEQSGLRPHRIDRTVTAYVSQGLLMKAGMGKGGKYRLTNTGFEKADALARSIFEKIN